MLRQGRTYGRRLAVWCFFGDRSAAGGGLSVNRRSQTNDDTLKTHSDVTHTTSGEKASVLFLFYIKQERGRARFPTDKLNE